MKKTFRFLALGLMMLGGTMISWASVKPAVGTFVGQTVSGGVVKYQVIDDGLPAYDYEATNAAGDKVAVKAYPVEISGLDYDGLTAKSLTKLNIATSFTEKYGDELNGYYVARIIDTQGTNSALPNYKKAFYAMTDLTELTFAADANGLGADKFTFSVGDYSFYGCTSLATLVFPDNVNKIGKYAFQGTVITEFTIPSKCAEIGACAFNDTKKLGTVKVADAGNAELKTIDKQVFANSFVSVLDLSKATALQSINDQAFIFNVSDVNAQLKTVTLPDVAHATNPFVSLGTTGTCFANCMALEEVKNLEKSNVPAINPGAFQNCEKLKKLYFPATASIVTDGVTSPFLNTPALEELWFADGWNQIIGVGVYVSTSGKKIKYNSTTKKYELEDYTLTAADQVEEFSHLKKIIFMGDESGVISEYAFGGYAACTNLNTLEFKGTILGNGNKIGEGAFQNCENLVVSFATDETASGGFGFQNDKTHTGFFLIDDNAFRNTATAVLDFKKIGMTNDFTIDPYAFAECAKMTKVKFGDMSQGGAKAIQIKENAFVKNDILASVEFATATLTNNSAQIFIWDGAFTENPALTTVTFGDLINHDAATPVNYYTGTTIIGYDASNGFVPGLVFGDGEHLKEVTIGTATLEGGLGIGPEAFASTGLTTITFANVKAPKDLTAPSGFMICDKAFYSGDGEADKTVVFGTISDDATAASKGTLGFQVAQNAFSGKGLKSVTIGDMTASIVKLDGSAFAGEKLQTVNLGKIADHAKNNATVTISTRAFANTNADDVMTENITIGELDATSLTIDANAFNGPQKAGSTFNVTIKAKTADADGNFAGLEKGATIAANAFCPATVGISTYTLGDIDATTGIAAGAFVGSLDENGKSNSDVVIGNYNKMFPAYDTFTNVDDLTAASWNAASYVSKIGVPVTLTVTGNVTQNLWGDAAEGKITSLTFGGNIVSPAGINDFGAAVRKIAFTSEDPLVYAGAIKTHAFEPASDDALAKNESLSVIYRVKTAKNSNAIFEQRAFNNVDDGKKNVILYTDQWSLEHTFQNVEIGGADEQVYRIMLSASSVAPGEAIKASCITGANGKYAYGRLYVPAGAGMLYKIAAKQVDGKNQVNVFSASISGTDIYMNQLTVMEGYYWIDATEAAQTLIVRTSEVGAAAGDAVEVLAEAVTADEKQALYDAGKVIDTDWFDAYCASRNALKYATSDITPAEFQNDAATNNKGIYVMANPKKNNLAFALYDQTKSTTKDLQKGSVYVVTRSNQYARLNVIWPEGSDEESDATAINAIENEESNNDAIYNLQGVRVNNAQKGIFIINGKKVVK